jgi:hypothetical protein
MVQVMSLLLWVGPKHEICWLGSFPEKLVSASAWHVTSLFDRLKFLPRREKRHRYVGFDFHLDVMPA